LVAAGFDHEPDRARLDAGGKPAGVRVRLLDGFELTCDGDVVALPLSIQRLLAFLALQGRPVSRAYVAGNLWFERTEGNAHACLRSALWRLPHCSLPLVEATRSQLSLAPHVAVDVREQICLARRVINPALPLEDVDYRAVLEGELLLDWYDDWVLFERERLRQLRLHALEALAEHLTAQGRYGEAVEAACAALHAAPLRESAHGVLIRVHLAEGNRGEAIRQYRLCRSLLSRKLGLEPPAELDALVEGLSAEGRDGMVAKP
jgi:DNA-binding SARP family transcriptional activator